MQDNEKVSMRKAPLLKLDNMDDCLYPAEYIIFGDVRQQGVPFDFEDTRNEIGTVVCFLDRIQFSLDFRPIRIAGESDEEIRFAYDLQSRLDQVNCRFCYSAAHLYGGLSLIHPGIVVAFAVGYR